jgi:hypothetical protein
MVVQSQPGQIVQETLSQKHPSQKRTGGVAQGVGPEFKPQYPNNNNVNSQSKQTNKGVILMTG